MRKELYAGIGIAGLVFAMLSFLVTEDEEMAYTFLLGTAFLLGYLFYLGEYRYYREHNALLASLQFLAVPIILLTIGNILAPRAYEAGFIDVTIELMYTIDASSSYASIILILPMISILSLTARYYDGRYPGFVIRRRQFGNFKLPFLIHLISLGLVILTSMWIELIDLMAFIYLVLSIAQMFQKIIIPPIAGALSGSSDRVDSRERRSFLNSITGSSSSRRRNSGGAGGGSSRSSSSSSSNQALSPSSTSQSRRRRRNIPTAPSEGYRDIPTRSRNSRSSSSSRNSNGRTRRRTRPTPSRSVAEVDRGIEVASSTKKKKVRSAKLKNYLPQGNFDASDLQCIVCYSDFSEKSTQNIVVCPSCKFPGHELEFMSWLNTSDRCPRCNKEIPNKRSLKSRTVSESQYAKFIRKL